MIINNILLNIELAIELHFISTAWSQTLYSQMFIMLPYMILNKFFYLSFEYLLEVMCRSGHLLLMLKNVTVIHLKL
jgi:hypothetical protein